MSLACRRVTAPRVPALLLFALGQWVAAGSAQASADVRGEVFTHTSPNGVVERCLLYTSRCV